MKAAVTTVMGHPSLSEILRDCVNYRGDVDTVATIALAAASCSRNVRQELPQQLVDGLENRHEDWLYQVYRQLEEFGPRTYSLSSEAKQAYARWYNWLDDRRCSETQQGLRSVYAKMKGDTGVLALLLHCLDAAIAGQPPAPQVELDTMRRAIRLSQYYLNQVRLIHAKGESADTLQDHCQRLIKLSQRKEWIEARDVHMSDRLIRKQRSTDEVRALFRELVAMGIGELSGEGRQLEWRYRPPVDGAVDNQESTRSAPPGSHERPLAEAASTLSTGQDNNGHKVEQENDLAIEQWSTGCQQEESISPGVDTRKFELES